MKTRLDLFVLFFGMSLSLCLGCRPHNDARTSNTCEDAPLASYQAELLDIAFAAASAMPVFPHIKNRSRAQEEVVTACLELDQPQRAVRYIEQIENWRRGAGYADLALHCAQQRARGEVEPYLALAAQIAEKNEDWRKDRIKAKIAAARVYLGQSATRPKQQSIPPSERGVVILAEAMTCAPESFDAQMEFLEKLIATEDFDIVKASLEACAELYSRSYDDPGMRTRLEERIKASWGSLPVFVRVELMMALADAALDHGDRAKALEWANEAKATMDAAQWQPRFGVPLMAKVAQRRFLAGDEAGAYADAQAALDLFNSSRETIVNIYRAEVIRPLAEAYHAMGEPAKALDLYKQAVEAGMENPNSRPRAEDLAATCCSMALHAFEPDTALWDRIREIRDCLGDPW